MNEFFHTLRRFKLASALNLLGLTTALTVCYVFWTQVEFATHYNRCITDYENVYRMELTGTISGEIPTTTFPRPLINRIAQDPQIEGYFLDAIGYGVTMVEKGKEKIPFNMGILERNGMSALKPKMLCGTDTLTTSSEYLIPASFAKTYFGTEMAAGKDIMEGMKVTGVYEDYPENCMCKNMCYTYVGTENEDEWSSWNYGVYFRLIPGANPKEAEERICKILTDIFQTDDKKLEITLRPITETYFSGIGDDDTGNKGMTVVLQIASLLLLIVAAINFANFTLAETPMRIKSVNTRKVLGMSNTELRLGMISETLLTSFIAFAFSISAIYLLDMSPWIQHLIVGTLAIEKNMHIIIAIAAVAAIIGIFVGLYPAFYATSFQPALVLKGSFGLSPRGQLIRKILVCIQLFVAFVMTIYIGVLFSQSSYIFNSDYGFDKDEIMYANNYVYEEDFQKVRSSLEQISGVEEVSFTQTMPGAYDRIMTWIRGENEKRLTLLVMPVDRNFLRFLGIEIIEGRDFNDHDSDCYIINESAKKKYDWIKIDQPICPNDMPVIGVCKNFRVLTTRHDNSKETAAFIVFGEKHKDWNMSYNTVVRVGKNIDKIEIKKKLDAALDKIIQIEEDPTDFRFMDEQLQKSYEDEFRFIRQVEVFSLICLIITLVGVFCLTMFETEYRRKEIGLRKIMGSNTRDIILMFCRRYTLLLIIAFIFAAPLAYYMAEKWLQNFAERTPIHWWLWPTGLAIVSTIVLFTISAQTLKTSRENPVNSIKSE